MICVMYCCYMMIIVSVSVSASVWIRVKKTDEGEEVGTELTDGEIEELSQGA